MLLLHGWQKKEGTSKRTKDFQKSLSYFSDENYFQFPICAQESWSARRRSMARLTCEHSVLQRFPSLDGAGVALCDGAGGVNSKTVGALVVAGADVPVDILL